MKKATVMNEGRRIQKVLEEYLGNRKAAKVAVEISVAMQVETQHTHSGEVFFVHKDEAGKLVLTMESEIKENVLTILNSYLEEDEAQECIEQLMAENCETKATTEFETIKIPGSGPFYAELLKHKPENGKEAKFIANLKEAISKSISDFEVFVNDPSMDNGKLQFVPGFKPAVGYSYNEWEELTKENGLRLGTKDEYILFLGWLITGLINEGWAERDAWFAVCTNSKELGHYNNSAEAKDKYDFEPTGSRRIVGKCDLANTRKILAKDEKAGGFWLAGGICNRCGDDSPLANLFLLINYVNHYDDSVGWFVL